MFLWSWIILPISLNESVSLSENFTYETGLAVATPTLAVGRIVVGINNLLGFGLSVRSGDSCTVARHKAVQLPCEQFFQLLIFATIL